jgi:hypothetical protein
LKLKIGAQKQANTETWACKCKPKKVEISRLKKPWFCRFAETRFIFRNNLDFRFLPLLSSCDTQISGWRDLGFPGSMNLNPSFKIAKIEVAYLSWYLDHSRLHRARSFIWRINFLYVYTKRSVTAFKNNLRWISAQYSFIKAQRHANIRQNYSYHIRRQAHCNHKKKFHSFWQADLWREWHGPAHW